MKVEDLQIGQKIDVKYRSIEMGDKIRWFYNLSVTAISEELTITNCRGTITYRMIHFTQQQKNGRIKNYYLSSNDIYSIVLH